MMLRRVTDNLHDMVEPHIRFATGPTQLARSMPPDRLIGKILPAHRFELTTLEPLSFVVVFVRDYDARAAAKGA